MKTLLSIVAIVFLAVGSATAQITHSSIHDIIDARSIALGESTVARPRSSGGWNSNPAALAGINGTGVQYGHRGFYTIDVYLPDGFGYRAFGIWLGTPLGTFAFHYNTFDEWATYAACEGGADGGLIREHDRTRVFSYGTNLLARLSIGVSLKELTEIVDLLSGEINSGEVKAGIYVDLGLLYSFPCRTGMHDSLHLGIAVQNIGREYHMFDLCFSNDSHMVPVGQWLRAGLAYDMTMLDDTNARPLCGSVTAEYRRLMNPHNNYRRGGEESLGVGLEATIYDLLILRLGAVVQAEDNLYGREGEPAFRYGIGLNLPLQKIGLDLPVAISFDYARIPLHDFLNDGSAYERDDLDAIGVRVAYTAPIFR